MWVTGQSAILGYYAMGPAFDVAFDRMVIKDPLLRAIITRSRVYDPNITSCSQGAGESVAGRILEAVRNTSAFVILLSTGIAAFKTQCSLTDD